ncbi:MAG: Fic/DOC family N-terminal domain-containing protein [Chitinophagales bacterium]
MSKYQINPDRNIPWNDLPDLPIDKQYYQTVEVLEKLGDAKAALARLHGRSAVLPNQGILINTISLQEAKFSSEIENVFTTDDELYKAYSDDKEDATGASKEVLRYREALWSGYEYLEQNNCFDLEYFNRIYREIKMVNDSIRPPFSNTRIKQRGTGPNAGSTVYTPPKGVEIIKAKLERLIEFVNDDEKYNIDHLLKMAMAHYQFEAIHPYRDGNGRTGRIFNIHYLTLKKLLDLPILFHSRYILENKEDYYHYLQGVSQRGDWENWLLFMLRAIESTSNITFHKINDIVEAKENIGDYLNSEKFKFNKLEKLLEMIFIQPYTKVKHLVEAKLYSENTAREYLNQLCELQVLEKKTIQGHHYYLNLELHKILSE